MKRLMLYETLGHFDIRCRIVHIANGLHARSRRSKRQFFGHISAMFDCFSLIRLTEIADNGICAWFNNMPTAYSGGLLQPHSSTFTYGHGLHPYGAFPNTPRSPSVWACVCEASTQVSYGVFEHFVAHEVLINTSTINLRHGSDVGGVCCSRRLADP